MTGMLLMKGWHRRGHGWDRPGRRVGAVTALLVVVGLMAGCSGSSSRRAAAESTTTALSTPAVSVGQFCSELRIFEEDGAGWSAGPGAPGSPTQGEMDRAAQQVSSDGGGISWASRDARQVSPDWSSVQIGDAASFLPLAQALQRLDYTCQGHGYPTGDIWATAMLSANGQ